MMNTHQKYDTVDHHHFDFAYTVDGSLHYPRSALALVQCTDGRWFLEQEFGTEYSHFEGVLKSSADLETVPVLYADVEAAARAAFRLVRQVYPDTPEERLSDFLRD